MNIEVKARHWPEECIAERCTYYKHYLSQGPPDLTHVGYHNVEKQYERWQVFALSFKGDPPAWVERLCQQIKAKVRA